jgi:carbon monoxide dehydrogenase subunit G
MNRIKILLLFLFSALQGWSANGDIFTATTIEGVNMTFRVISETDKTCQVGQDDYFKPSINTYTTGTITIPSNVNDYTVTTIGGYSFIGCNNITSIIIPNSVENIKGYAFTGDFKTENLISVKSITIPSSVKYIGSYAFSGTCIESIQIPSEVSRIADSAFDSCNKLISLSVDNNNTTYDSRNNCNAIIETASNKLIAGISTTIIPNSVKCIGTRAFFGITGLISVTLPSSIEDIAEYAFYGCNNLTSVKVEMKIPVSLTSNTFSNQSNAILYVPYGCKSVYKVADCWKDFKEIIEETSTTYTLSIKAAGNGSASYNATSVRGGTSTFTVNEGTSATITFTPDNGFRIKNVKVNSTDVTSSVSNNSYTISNINSDTAVEVEFGLIEFELNGLNYSVIPNTNNVKVTGKLSTYTGAIVIPESASYQGKSYSVKVIDDDAFNSCIDITSVSFPNTLSDVYEGAFYGCDNIETVYIPSIKAWCNIEFENSSANPLCYAKHFIVNGNEESEIVIDEGIEWIHDFAFAKYVGITSVTLPSTLTILDRAFGGCVNLQLVISKATTPPSVEDYAWRPFSGISENAILQVPKGTKSAYLAIPAWSNNFKEIVEESESYVLSIKATGNGSVSYNGTPIRGKTSTFTVNEGTSATITFAPDNGYRIKSVKVNNTDVTSKVSNNSYTISNISSDTSVEVIFEAITHTLSIKATGNGSVSYSGTSIREKTSTFTVIEGTSATITFAPVVGNRIKSVKVNNVVVTSNVTDNQYTISNISSDTSVEVEFEVIPPTTYTLSIKATGNGSVTYSGTSIQGKTSIFTVNEGTSATITFAPDNGYRIKSVKVNSTDVTSSVSNNSYTISSITGDTSVEVEFEIIPPTTYTLSIKAIGNGSATYSGTSIRGKTSTFTVNEGTSATITFAPNNGNRIKSVKVNNVVVTSNVIDNQYTISNISSDMSVEVEFEAIPTYTLKITSTGNGFATYNGTAVRSGSNTFTVLEGASATISLTADDGHRIKSVKVNNQDVTASVANNRYIINNISANTTVEVTFEEIPPTTYTLSITATGNGSVTYGETTLKNQTQQFTVNEGSYATIAISPESGYRIKSVMQNGTDVTASVSNNQYTTSKITGNTSLEVTFELIPIPTYTLTITASGNGTAVYNTATIKNQTQQFTVNEGTSVTVMFNPDNGNSIKSVKVNGTEVTSEVSGNRYVISSMAANTTVEVEFKEDINALTVEGVNFTVTSQSDKSIVVAGGNYGQVLTVPATVTQDGTTWTVKGIDNDALKNNTELAAVIWNAEAVFTATVSNPNLLLYVKAAEFAPGTIKNVIVNGIADNITLMDASSGNGFYCPQAFTAQKITYTHYYSMTTGIGESRGWETIALPFDVQTIAHESKGTIVPFANWKREDAEKPFWLYELTGSGFVAAGSIKAYTPYIISMPNNPQYDAKWRLNGRVTFTATSVTVGATENVYSATYTDRTFTPCFTDKTANEGLLALNVINDYSQERGGSPEGSRFIMNLRNIHPFEAYMTTTSNARAYIDVFEDMTTDIETIGYEPLEKEGAVYDLKGHKVKTPSRKGVYIINGKKQIIK